MYEFKFYGGSYQAQATLKFHLFVAPGDGKAELHLFQAKKDGLVIDVNRNTFTTSCSTLKVFTSLKGFGVPSCYFSVYIRLGLEFKQQVKLLPIYYDKIPNYPRSGHFFFETNGGRFLKNSEVAELIGADSESYKYYSKQRILPLNEMRKYVITAPIGAVINQNSVRTRIIR